MYRIGLVLLALSLLTVAPTRVLVGGLWRGAYGPHGSGDGQH